MDEDDDDIIPLIMLLQTCATKHDDLLEGLQNLLMLLLSLLSFSLLCLSFLLFS